MGTETERQLVDVLKSVVDELRDLQAAGRMRDSESRAHVAFLERGLRHAEERLAGREHGRRRPEWWEAGYRRSMLS